MNFFVRKIEIRLKNSKIFRYCHEELFLDSLFLNFYIFQVCLIMKVKLVHKADVIIDRECSTNDKKIFCLYFIKNDNFHAWQRRVFAHLIFILNERLYVDLLTFYTFRIFD